MSKESAVLFYERLESDNELIDRLKGMNVVEAERMVRDDLGYDFTKEEMQKVIFERNPELSDDELEAVVGGLSGEEIGGIITVGGAVIAAGIGVVGIAAVALGGAAA